MKPIFFIPLFCFLFSNALHAQIDIPKDIPLKGKLISYEIFVVTGDSLNPVESSVEKTIYDKNGRILELRKGNVSMGESPFIRKHVYSNGKEVIYECECKDIEPFVKDFIIRDRNELKNKPSYLTDKGPTHWVTINTLDKKGNVIHSSHYSRSGYRTQDVRFEYNAANKILKRTVFNMDSVPVLTEINTYYNRGNLTKKIVKRKNTTESEEIRVYDSKNRLIEKRYLEQNKLRIHLEFSVKILGNTKEFITTDRMRDSSYVEKIVTYDKLNREIKRQEFISSGNKPRITEWEYFTNGNVKSITYYNEDGALQRKVVYGYDKRNNWVVAFHSKRVTVYDKGVKREEIWTTKYVQKIIYK